MKKEQWNESLNHIDDDLVEEFVAKSAKLESKNKRFWLRLGAMAACFCLIAGMLFLFSQRLVWEDTMFSAQEIADIMGVYDSLGTQAYKEVYATSKDYLYVNKVPSGKYLDIYQRNELSVAIQEQEFKDFIDSFNGKLASALDIEAPLFEISAQSILGKESLRAEAENEKYSISASQSGFQNMMYLYARSTSDKKIVLDGETVQIDQRMTDREIINSLKSVKNKLFDIFGVTFEDVKIRRDYVNGENLVFLYNESAHPLNEYVEYPYALPYTDYIRIRFEMDLSEDISYAWSISYDQKRNDVSEKYQSIAREKRISLKEAEALLYKGYTFAGHTCDKCMANNEYVSFKGYDLVGFEYLFDTKQEIGVPFYTFYKEIGQLNNIKTYAKTYVPAIPVSGYEEYFESQLKNHREW